VETSGFFLAADATLDAVASLIESRTSPKLRAAMNGGLSRQIFRKVGVFVLVWTYFKIIYLFNPFVCLFASSFSKRRAAN